MNRDISSMRENYKWGNLLESQVEGQPMDQFRQWLEEAIASKLPEPNAMNLATVNAEGRPSSRIVLLKDLWEEGFVFYTNYNSRKGKDLDARPFGAINFLWKEIERQVRIEGHVSKIPKEKSEAYFHSRPFESQIGAIASAQSSKVKNREQLEQRYAELKNRYEAGGKAPMPEDWGGYILKPDYYEFWQGRESRLHDRIEYQLEKDGSWSLGRLEP